MTDAARLERALGRLDARIDWERRDRSKGWRVDLDPIRDLVGRAGHPERGFEVCHVAGSKGKGSVSSLIAAGLRRAGLEVGVFGSPHVERVNERVRIGARPAEDAVLAAAVEEALGVVAEAEAAGSAGGEASWFDIMTLAGLCAFRAAGVDRAVLEVGLGGRLDSTNVIAPPALAVVTTIALEHTAILGDTLGAIAREKGGIIKPGSRLVTGTPPDSEAGLVLAAMAAERGVPHAVAWSEDDRTFEEANLRVARAALDDLGLSTPGLGGHLLGAEQVAEARLPGRMEWFELPDVPVLLDGAHVASSLDLAVREARAAWGGPWCGLVAVHGEKDLLELLAPLARAGFERLFATTVPGTGVHHTGEAVAAAAEALGVPAEVHGTPEAALEAARAWSGAQGARVMATGSLYLVGALRGLLAGTEPLR